MNGLYANIAAKKKRIDGKQLENLNE